MPDHLHCLLSLERHEVSYINGGARVILPEGILNQVAGFKSFTTTQIWWKQGGKGPLWQRSSCDRVIRHNQSIQHAASYILDNPVRKGIVKQWQDYPYSRIVDCW
jgi:REP-associated tyrosine transposase